MITLTPVASSNLDSIGYDANTQELLVRFKSGYLYAYEDVPKEEYEELMNARSKGSYFSQNIRDIYGHRRVA